MRPFRDDDESWEMLEVAFRRLPQLEAPPALRERCLPGAAAAGARRVLVVEDEPAIRRLLELHLSRAGYAVTMAGDGMEALETISRERPDMVVLDVMMPRMDAFELLRRLKAEPDTHEIPVLMLTAKAQDADVFRGWQTGADCYLTKPFNPTELLAWVRRVFETTDAADRGQYTI